MRRHRRQPRPCCRADGLLLGLDAAILVPGDMVAERIAAIRSEGADVEVIDGGYDDAIAASAALASDTTLVISTSLGEGYTEPPGWSSTAIRQ